MASPARHLSLLAFVAVLAVVAPHASAWGGGRLFFSKTTRPEAAVDAPEKASVATTTAVPTDAANPNSAMEFSRPSTGGGGRGYGLYGRPLENFPSDYFRRDVHGNAEKLTTTNVPTTSAAADEAVPVGGRGERAEPSTEDNGSGRGRPPWTNANLPTTTSTEPFVEDNGSGRGRPPWTNANLPTTSTTEETVPAVGGERSFAEDNGSGMGRRPWRYGRDDADGRRPEVEQRNYYGMSDTRLYQNGRYYYNVDTGRYGYGRESNPVRTRPEQFGGAGDRRGRYYYGNAAAGYYQYGNDNDLGNGVMENQDGFHVEGRNGRLVP